jgi:hypothetical protein
VSRYRAACESLSVANFAYASAHDIEQKLWTAHLKVNTAFRQEHKIVRHMLTRRIEAAMLTCRSSNAPKTM